MAQVVRTLDYDPRPQFVPFHNRTQRWSCVVAHRRSGKTVSAVNDLLMGAMYTKKHNARFAYVAPFYAQAKQVAWQYLKEGAKPFIRQASDVRESELCVRLFNGAWVRLYGSDNPNALRGIYNDGVVVDEFGDCRPSLWGEVLLPTLADRKGWGHFIGTPKGKNHFYDIAQLARTSDDWYFMELKASESGILPESELEQLRGQMSEAQYAQEMECDFTAAVLGTYYSALVQTLELKGQIAPEACKHDPDFPVHVSADLGYTDSCSWWFWQHRPDGIAVIDYEEAHSEPLSFYFDMLRNKPYKYETIWLPHDARAKTLQTGRSTVEQFLAEEFPVRIAPNISVQQGIDAARLILNRTYIDSTTCAHGIEALRAYRRKYDELNKSFTDKPLHDWSSHGSDAFRYLALVCRESVALAAPNAIATPYKPDGYNLEQLYADRKTPTHQFNRLRI